MSSPNAYPAPSALIPTPTAKPASIPIGVPCHGLASAQNGLGIYGRLSLLLLYRYVVGLIYCFCCCCAICHLFAYLRRGRKKRQTQNRTVQISIELSCIIPARIVIVYPVCEFGIKKIASSCLSWSGAANGLDHSYTRGFRPHPCLIPHDCYTVATPYDVI